LIFIVPSLRDSVVNQPKTAHVVVQSVSVCVNMYIRNSSDLAEASDIETIRETLDVNTLGRHQMSIHGQTSDVNTWILLSFLTTTPTERHQMTIAG
jgi:hypothetical protein